eukprot:gene13407-biopygen21560
MGAFVVLTGTKFRIIEQEPYGFMPDLTVLPTTETGRGQRSGGDRGGERGCRRAQRATLPSALGAIPLARRFKVPAGVEMAGELHLPAGDAAPVRRGGWGRGTLPEGRWWAGRRGCGAAQRTGAIPPVKRDPLVRRDATNYVPTRRCRQGDVDWKPSPPEASPKKAGGVDGGEEPGRRGRNLAGGEEPGRRSGGGKELRQAPDRGKDRGQSLQF